MKKSNQPQIGTLNSYFLNNSILVFTTKAFYKSLSAQEKQTIAIAFTGPSSYYVTLASLLTLNIFHDLF